MHSGSNSFVRPVQCDYRLKCKPGAILLRLVAECRANKPRVFHLPTPKKDPCSGWSRVLVTNLSSWEGSQFFRICHIQNRLRFSLGNFESCLSISQRRLYNIYYNALNLWNWISKLSEDKNVELWRVILFEARCLLQLVQSQYFSVKKEQSVIICFANDLDVCWTGWAVYSSTICQTFQLDSNFGRGSRNSKSSPLSHCFLLLFGRHVTGLNKAWTLGTRVHWQMLTWNFHGSRFAERMSQYPWMVSLSPLRPIVL